MPHCSKISSVAIKRKINPSGILADYTSNMLSLNEVFFIIESEYKTKGHSDRKTANSVLAWISFTRLPFRQFPLVTRFPSVKEQTFSTQIACFSLVNQ